MSVSVMRMMELMRTDAELKQTLTVEDWTDIETAFNQYESVRRSASASTILAEIRKTWVTSMVKIISRQKLKELAQNEIETMSAPRDGGATTTSSCKRQRDTDDVESATVPAAKYRRAGLSSLGSSVGGSKTTIDGYAEASASADAAAQRGGDEDKRDQEEQVDLRQGFDVLKSAGVDIAQEDANLSAADDEARIALTKAAAAAEAQEPFVTGEALLPRLLQLTQQFGLTGVDENAAELMAAATEYRLCMVLNGLSAAARQRTDADQTRFGDDGFRLTTNPRLSFHKQKEATAARAAVAAHARAASGVTQTSDKDGTPRMPNRIDNDAGSGAEHVEVSKSDVLHVLDGEPQSVRSRVGMWWRCMDRPLKQYVRYATRMFV